MIVLFWPKIFIQLFLSCGCCSNKGRKRGSRQSDVVSTANAAKKQGADSVLQSNFSSHQKGDPVSLAWKIKRSTRLIIFKKKTNINLNVLIRHLFFLFLFLNFQCRSALRWCWCSDGADTRVKSAKTRFAFDQNACRVFGYRKIMAKTKEKTFFSLGVFLLLREAYFPPSQVKLKKIKTAKTTWKTLQLRDKYRGFTAENPCKFTPGGTKVIVNSLLSAKKYRKCPIGFSLDPFSKKLPPLAPFAPTVHRPFSADWVIWLLAKCKGRILDIYLLLRMRCKDQLK